MNFHVAIKALSDAAYVAVSRAVIDGQDADTKRRLIAIAQAAGDLLDKHAASYPVANTEREV